MVDRSYLGGLFQPMALPEASAQARGRPRTRIGTCSPFRPSGPESCSPTHPSPPPPPYTFPPPAIARRPSDPGICSAVGVDNGGSAHVLWDIVLGERGVYDAHRRGVHVEHDAVPPMVKKREPACDSVDSDLSACLRGRSRLRFHDRHAACEWDPMANR